MSTMTLSIPIAFVFSLWLSWLTMKIVIAAPATHQETLATNSSINETTSSIVAQSTGLVTETILAPSGNSNNPVSKNAAGHLKPLNQTTPFREPMTDVDAVYQKIINFFHFGLFSNLHEPNDSVQNEAKTTTPSPVTLPPQDDNHLPNQSVKSNQNTTKNVAFPESNGNESKHTMLVRLSPAPSTNLTLEVSTAQQLNPNVTQVSILLNHTSTTASEDTTPKTSDSYSFVEDSTGYSSETFPTDDIELVTELTNFINFSDSLNSTNKNIAVSTNQSDEINTQAPSPASFPYANASQQILEERIGMHNEGENNSEVVAVTPDSNVPVFTWRPYQLVTDEEGVTEKTIQTTEESQNDTKAPFTNYSSISNQIGDIRKEIDDVLHLHSVNASRRQEPPEPENFPALVNEKIVLQQQVEDKAPVTETMPTSSSYTNEFTDTPLAEMINSTTILSFDQSTLSSLVVQHAYVPYTFLDHTLKGTNGSIQNANHCFYNGREYATGQHIEQLNPCQFCICVNGFVDCYWKNCPPAPEGCMELNFEGVCDRSLYLCPIPKKGEPLPFPVNSIPRVRRQANGTAELSCNILGVEYKIGELVGVASDPCMECRCALDSLYCSPKCCFQPSATSNDPTKHSRANDPLWRPVLANPLKHLRSEFTAVLKHTT